VRSLLGYACALVLTVGIGGCRSRRIDHAASAAPVGSAAPDERQRADCSKIKACLRTLSPAYDPEKDSIIRREVDACFGSKDARYGAVHDCPPIEFTSDARNGRSVEAYTECGEVCTPEATDTGIRYVDVTHAECHCLGGTPLWFWGMGRYYGGCAPAPARTVAAAHDFAVDSRRSGNRDEYRVCFASGTERSPLLELPYVRIESIDGKPVRGPGQLEELFRSLPEHAPREIRMGRSARDPGGREIHFLDGAALASLVRTMEELTLRELPKYRHCSDEIADLTVLVGDQEYTRDLLCNDERTVHFRQLVRALEAAAASKPPRVRPPPPSCSEVRTLPTRFILRRNGHVLELRYVDWMRGSDSSRSTIERCHDGVARCEITDTYVLDGRIDDASDVIREMREDFRRCYTNALTHDADLGGVIDLSIRVGSHGNVGQVTVAPHGNLPASVVGCVKTRAARSRFRAPLRGTPVVVRTTLGFANG
jgi:hypothetical protein